MSPPDPDPIPEAELLGPPPFAPPVAEVVSIRCWRCDRLEVPRDGLCPACGARHRRDRGRRVRAPRRTARNPLTTVLVLHGVLLGTLVLGGWLTKSAGPDPDWAHITMAVLGVLDLALALVGIALVGPQPLPTQPAERRAAAWAAAWPVLAVLIGLNMLYFGAVRHYIAPPKFLTPPTPALDVPTILLICVEPAVVEELFFRFLAFGVLYRAAGAGTAVVVSSVMFAVTHISNPIGVPYFFVAGVVLAYARIYGGLLLPMILHFLHNLAVTAIEAGK